MKNNYVSYEQAKMAKEKGFNEPCLAYYREILISKEVIFYEMKKTETNKSLSGGIHTFYSAPTIEEFENWLKLI